MRRKRVSRRAEDWKRIVETWAGSGESQRAYCAKRDVGLSSFIRWRKLLREVNGKQRDGGFVAVGPLPVAASGAPALVLRLPGGVELALSRMPDAEWVRRIVRA